MNELKSAIDFSAGDFLTNPWPVYQTLRRSDPVHWAERYHSYVLLKHEDVSRAFTTEEFTVEHPFRASRQVMGRTVLDVDGPEHRRLKTIAGEKFRPGAVNESLPDIERWVGEALAALRPGQEIDFVTDIARRIPLHISCRMAGLPVPEDPWLFHCLADLMSYMDRQQGGLAYAVSRRKEVENYLNQFLQSDGRERLAGVLGDFTAHCARGDLSPADALSHLILILLSSTVPVAAALGNTMTCLWWHRPAMAELAADPARHVADVVRESLRWQPPEQFVSRLTTREVELKGKIIRAGTPVLLSIGSANRDEDVYEDGETWNPRRREKKNLSFGFGEHHCFGYFLAEKEMQIIFRQLFERFPALQPAGDEAPSIRGLVVRSVRTLPLKL